MKNPEFDPYSKSYLDDLNKGISLSGESQDFFIENRLNITRSLLNEAPKKILDFGCGNGASFTHLHSIFEPQELFGFDVSQETLVEAKKRNFPFSVQFDSKIENLPRDHFDLVYTNGTFHHIPPSERPSAIQNMARVLKKGGTLALWENSPWSLAARWVMSRIPFDRDAEMLWPSSAVKTLRVAGFEIVTKEYHFIFPSSLKTLRKTESFFKNYPLGAQYLILCRRIS